MTRSQSKIKKSRDISFEYEIARAAAAENVQDEHVVDIGAIARSYYAHGYARALTDLADGNVTPPKPRWKP